MKLEIGDNFRITYHANKYDKTITRKGLWDDKSKTWVSKTGKKLITYFDIEANNYRTCANNFVLSVRG